MQTTLMILMTQNIIIYGVLNMHGDLKSKRIKKNKFKIAGGLFNSVKKNQHLILSVTFEIQ